MKVRRYGALLLVAVIVTACPSGDRTDRGTVTVPERRDRTALEPAPGGQVHEVALISDAAGNRFDPATLSVRRGDVIRWRLRSGVHNAHFVRDSNPGMDRLPPRTPMLQLPGETFDTMVQIDTGDVYFQCDPHAMLGMVGRLTIASRPPGAP